MEWSRAELTARSKSNIGERATGCGVGGSHDVMWASEDVMERTSQDVMGNVTGRDGDVT